MGFRLVWLLCFVVGIQACGMTTHGLIAHRTIDYHYTSSFPGYDELISTYKVTVLGGAPFPDYLYACGDDHNNGELAHWPPFQAAAANYIRNRTKPWNESTEKLVAFFFGVTSHYIADIIWHGLAQVQNGYGFIENLGTQDFNCTGDLCSSAHSAADTGGEFVAAWQSNLTWLLPEQWYIPTDDLVNIYALLNASVNPLAIEECHEIFLAGSLAVKYLSEAVFREITEPAPFLVERYIDFPLGGVDDMAVWSSRMWDRFAEWLEDGPPANPPPELVDLDDYNHRDLIKLIRESAPILLDSPLLSSWKNKVDGFSTFKVPKDSEIREYINSQLEMSNSPAKKQVQAIVSQLTHKEPNFDWESRAVNVDNNNNNNFSIEREATFSYYSTLPLQYLGASWSSGDLNADGVLDSVIGGYGYSRRDRNGQVGSLQIQWGTQKGKGAMDVATQTTLLQTNETYARFGYATTILDFNLDGIDDLVAASPTSGNNWTDLAVDPTFTYWGSVQVFFGKKTTGAINWDKPDFVIYSTDNYTFFGTVLSTGDIDGDGAADLLIGSPLARANRSGEDSTSAIQRGSVRIFLSDVKRQSGTSVKDTTSDFAYLGLDQFAYFGSSILVVNVSTTSLLLVGAPGFRASTPSGNITVGRVFGYVVGKGIPDQTPLFTITGSVQQSTTGVAIGYGHPKGPSQAPVLAVAAPSQDPITDANNTRRAGAVWIVAIEKLLSGGDFVLNRTQVGSSYLPTLIESQHWGSRFGWSVLFSDLNGDGADELCVGAPFKTLEPPTFANRERGGVFIWNGNKLPTGVVDNAEDNATITLSSPTGSRRFGWVLASGHVTSDGRLDLIVTAPLSDYNTTKENSEMSGSLYVYSNLLP